MSILSIFIIPEDRPNCIGNPKQRHAIRSICHRGGPNRQLEKIPTVRSSKSLCDSTLFQPSDDNVFLSSLRDKIHV